MAIETIHESVLNHLLNSGQTGFSLRTKDKRNEEKLNKGYWFLGNDGFLNLSFWDSRDWRNKTHNIFFGINSESDCWLEFVDKDDSEKARFFEEIAPVIGLKQLKTKRNEKDLFLWKKEYTNSKDYLKSLDEFLKKDKPIIDAFIQAKGKTALLPAISQEDFNENLKHILERAKKGATVSPDTKILSMGQGYGQSYPLRLKGIMLENIGHFKHIELNLDQQVTCLIGENGSGKSSILRGIALGLAGISDNTVIDPNNEAIQKLLRIDRIEGDKEIYAAKGQINISYNKIHFQETGETNIINFKRQYGESVDSKGHIRGDFNIVEDGLNSDLRATTENYFVDLVIGFSQTKSLEDYRDSPQNGNGDLRPRISEVTSLIYNHPDKAFHKFNSWIVKVWSAKTSEKERQLKLMVLDAIFSTIQKIVGGIFELMPMQIEQTEIFVKTTDAPEGIPLHLISQGYNNVIGWVGYFMQRLWEVTNEYDRVKFKHTPAICLIDEIDTYLHPKWEKTILSVLAQEFPYTQFVVTTHSPVVIANLQNNFRIYRIVKHNNLMIAIEHNNAQFKPYGAESSRILRLLMDVKQERPKEVQEMMDAYNNAILENDFIAAQTFESQLKQLIDPNDPILVEGEATIEARKMLQEL